MNLKFSLLISIAILTINCYAQKKNPSVILYDKGNAAVAVKNYKAADSLFTLSINIAPHPDSYYNRAVCRRQMNDFKGYCVDLLSASDLGDNESKKLYWKQCAKADSVYKLANGEPATKTDFDISEFTTTYRYNTNYEYTKSNFSGKILLSKRRLNNTTFYGMCDDVINATYTGGSDNLVKYIKSNSELSKFVKEKDLAGRVSFFLTIDETGKVKDVVSDEDETDNAVEEIVNALKNSGNWNPAIYNAKAVNFQMTVFALYYDSVLTISPDLSLTKKDISGVGKEYNEEMPEFPGGMAQLGPFLQKNLQYPVSAKEAGLMGKCYLKFVVLPNGRLSNFAILRGVPGCPECDREALRVVKSMPRFKPGKQDGKPVAVFFNLPINFNLR